MSNASGQQHEVVAYYWNAYFDWRARCGFENGCMLELVAAIRASIHSGEVQPDAVPQLKKLAGMIEMQLINVNSDCRAA